MSFEMLVCAWVCLILTMVTLEIAQQEPMARVLVVAAVTSSSQYQQLEQICESQTRHFKRGFGCHTDLYWIKDQSEWIRVCEDLSVPNTRPHRWFMVRTDCGFSFSSRQIHRSDHTVIRITHWVSKS